VEHNLVLAGVGGQGILSIARALSLAALERGLQVKQAEVHGMSQRGGAVHSHVRVADHELFSDLIAMGQADLILAVEPLEALRYVQYLRADGVIVAATNAVMNIDNYPPIEQVLERVAQFPQHVLLDMDKLARAAGSPRAANMVALGAASLFLELDNGALQDAVGALFSSKGPKVVEANRRAFRFGRTAALAYRDGLQRGGTSRTIRQWIDTLSPEHLASEEPPEVSTLELTEEVDRLSGAEAHAVERMLVRAYDEGRKQLYEHEVYTLVELVGAISPPRYVFVPKGGMIAEENLAQFPGERVVLKLVSPDVVHKSDAQAVLFVPKQLDAVRREIDRLVERHAAGATVAGVLVVEYVEPEFRGFGSELFVGVRATREFGPVIAAGLGGVDTEYLASKMRPGVAVAKAVATDTSAEAFLEMFKATAAYDVLAGRVRGHRRIVSDGELLRCFRAFIAIARRFCVDRGEVGPDVGELEVNPFAFRQQRLIPLDGRGQLRTATHRPPPRPLDKVRSLLEPRTIGVLGVSAKSMNFGRIILANVRRCGFPAERLVIIKDDAREVDGVRCVTSLAALTEPLDLLVIAAPATELPAIVHAANESGKVRAAVMIPGGVGETEGSAAIEAEVRAAIAAGRQRPDGGTVFLGPNCMGVQSRPGGYDTFFIPPAKLDTRWRAPARRVAVVSQSGAFIIARLSQLATLDPAIAVSIGNQLDLTVADLLRAVGARDDIDAIGVYVEGFADTDGLDFLRATAEVTAAGKSVVFYKAGRTETGRSAAAGHTASVAGDYDICLAAAAHAGALVADSFRDFEHLLELATFLHGKAVGGPRVFALTNAGMEAVAMADAVRGPDYEITMPLPSEALRAAMLAALQRHKLERLVNARNPLDLTPMANEDAYLDLARLLLDSNEVDALILSCVPLTPQLKTTPDELRGGGSLAERLPQLFAETRKPLVFVVDAGALYDPLASAVRAAGVPVFRTSDQAARALGRYLVGRRQPTAPQLPT
jgi:indolepyruvate ferredoxin oxidoreductase beta subunit